MNKIFNGLLPFEIILLIMGVIIFLVLLFLLVWSVMKRRAIVTLLPFFLLPVVLVGYPSIQSVQFKDNGLTIQKYTRVVNNDPSDTAARNKLSEALIKFKNSNRTQQNADALATVAGAQLALGKLDAASLTVQKAVQLDPNSNSVRTAARQVGQQVEVEREFHQNISRLSELLNEFHAAPRDTVVAAGITRTLSGIRSPAYVDASSALVIAKAYAMMDQQQQSVKVINKVLEADPGSAEAKELKDQVVTNQFNVNKEAGATGEKTFRQNITLHPSVLKAVVKDNKAVNK